MFALVPAGPPVTSAFEPEYGVVELLRAAGARGRRVRDRPQAGGRGVGALGVARPAAVDLEVVEQRPAVGRVASAPSAA